MEDFMKLVPRVRPESRPEGSPLATRLAAGALYGMVAGALLHDHAGVAGAVMVAVWVATVWLPSSIRAPGEARHNPAP
jgi:hypothetical protein